MEAAQHPSMSVGQINYIRMSVHHSYSHLLVYRVNWLRAKARRDRWVEEKDLLESELLWTKLYFEHQQQVWLDRASGACDRGFVCYAYRQARDWGLLVTQSLNALSVV